jgi:hypothetical protein
MRQHDHPAGGNFKENALTGIVISTTLDDMPNGTDYWINVVFLDGSRATLFYDEVKVLVKNENR